MEWLCATLAESPLPEGWSELVRGMRDAIAGDPGDLLLLAIAFGLVLLFLVNLRVARKVEKSLAARAEQRRISHPARDGKRTG